jgi:hypothetical protein
MIQVIKISKLSANGKKAVDDIREAEKQEEQSVYKKRTLLKIVPNRVT